MSVSVPIHFVYDDETLRPDRRWTIRQLEEIIGNPRSYASRTTLLLIVMPELSIEELDIDQLRALLDQYAPEHSLEVYINYDKGQHPSPRHVFCNPDERSTYQLRIFFVTSETMVSYKQDSLIPFDEMLGYARIRYTGLDSVDPGESVEINRILARGGHLAASLDVDPGMFPYTGVLVYFTSHGVRDRIAYSIMQS